MQRNVPECTCPQSFRMNVDIAKVEAVLCCQIDVLFNLIYILFFLLIYIPRQKLLKWSES